MNIRQTSDWIFRRLVLAGLVAVAGIVLFLAAAAGAYAQSGETEAAPATPDQPTGAAIWMGMMDVEWNEVPGAETYEVQYFNMRGWVDLPGDGIRNHVLRSRRGRQRTESQQILYFQGAGY